MPFDKFSLIRDNVCNGIQPWRMDQGLNIMAETLCILMNEITPNDDVPVLGRKDWDKASNSEYLDCKYGYVSCSDMNLNMNWSDWVKEGPYICHLFATTTMAPASAAE